MVVYFEKEKKPIKIFHRQNVWILDVETSAMYTYHCPITSKEQDN
jgi:hypothetical protein